MRKFWPAAALAAVAYSALSSRREPNATFHACDWDGFEAGPNKRTFRSLTHLVFHMTRALKLPVPLAEVYLMRVIPPRFRESIMVITSMANECNI